MHVGVMHHLGWAVVLTADTNHSVVDRRRIELVDEDLPAAPIHHRGGTHDMHNTGEFLDDDHLAQLVAEVRASAERLTSRALDQLAAEVPGAIQSISLRDWPDDFPDDIATQRRPPYESQVDSVMYRQVIAAAGTARGWRVNRFEAKDVIDEAAALVTLDIDAVLLAPRTELGPPWTKEHRTTLAATIVAAHT